MAHGYDYAAVANHPAPHAFLCGWLSQAIWHHLWAGLDHPRLHRTAMQNVLQLGLLLHPNWQTGRVYAAQYHLQRLVKITSERSLASPEILHHQDHADLVGSRRQMIEAFSPDAAVPFIPTIDFSPGDECYLFGEHQGHLVLSLQPPLVKRDQLHLVAIGAQLAGYAGFRVNDGDYGHELCERLIRIRDEGLISGDQFNSLVEYEGFRPLFRRGADPCLLIPNALLASHNMESLPDQLDEKAVRAFMQDVVPEGAVDDTRYVTITAFVKWFNSQKFGRNLTTQTLRNWLNELAPPVSAYVSPKPKNAHAYKLDDLCRACRAHLDEKFDYEQALHKYVRSSKYMESKDASHRDWALA